MTVNQYAYDTLLDDRNRAAKKVVAYRKVRDFVQAHFMGCQQPKCKVCKAWQEIVEADPGWVPE